MSLPKVYSIVKFADVSEKPYAVDRNALKLELDLIEKVVSVISANISKGLANFSLPSIWQNVHSSIKEQLAAKGLPQDMINFVNCGMFDLADYEWETKPRYNWTIVPSHNFFPELTKVVLISEAESKFWCEKRSYNEMEDSSNKKMLEALAELEKVYENCGVKKDFNKFVYTY